MICIRGGQCVRWRGVETWFIVSAEGNAFGGMMWKRGSLHPRSVAFAGHMHTVRWRRNVIPCIRGGQCVRWNGVETRFFASAERCLRRAHARSQMAQKRNALYPRRAMRSVEWRGNVVPCIRGALPPDGKCEKYDGAEHLTFANRSTSVVTLLPVSNLYSPLHHIYLTTDGMTMILQLATIFVLATTYFASNTRNTTVFPPPFGHFNLPIKCGGRGY